jgi:hypothetical protein
MRVSILFLAVAVGCASIRTKAPDPQCAGDRRAVVDNQLTVPVDIRINQTVLGPVQPHTQAEFGVSGGQTVYPAPSTPGGTAMAISYTDATRVRIHYVCTER